MITKTETKILIALETIKGDLKVVREHQEAQNGKVFSLIKELDNEKLKREQQIMLCVEERKKLNKAFMEEVEPIKKNMWIGIGVIGLAVFIFDIVIKIYL